MRYPEESKSLQSASMSRIADLAHQEASREEQRVVEDPLCAQLVHHKGHTLNHGIGEPGLVSQITFK